MFAARSPSARAPLHEQAFALIEFRGASAGKNSGLYVSVQRRGFQLEVLGRPPPARLRRQARHALELVSRPQRGSAAPCRNPGHARAYAASQQSTGSHCGSPLCLVPCGTVVACEFCSRVFRLSVMTGIRENPRKPAPTLAIGYFMRKAYAYYVVLRVAAAYRCGWLSRGRAIRVRRITTKAESIPSDIRLAAHRAWHLTCSKQRPKSPN